MKQKIFTSALAIIANTVMVFATSYAGGLPGLFSINAQGGQVCFSQGNLQYLAASGQTTHPDGTTSAGTWRFAPQQYACVGTQNTSISATSTVWIDLFGWGTSGYNNTANDPCAMHYQPYSSTRTFTDCTETNITGYGPSLDQEFRGLIGTSAYYDWGVYDAISNSEAGAAWRTLSYGEWHYILKGRPNADSLKSQATIGSMHGCILLPDNWETPEGLTFVPYAKDYETNTYTVDQWSTMEAAGAVFLPAAGQRREAQLRNGNTDGYYWSTSANNTRQAQIFHFNDTAIYTNSRYARHYGLSIRLVRDIDPQIDPIAKFEGFDSRGCYFGDWIYNNGGFQNLENITVTETDSIFHKYTLSLTTGGQACAFSLGGVYFRFIHKDSNKYAFKTANGEIHPDGKDRQIIIPTYPGDEILISVVDTVEGVRADGVDSAYIHLYAGDNILQATADSIVITSSNAAGEERKMKISAILCIAHHPEYTGVTTPAASQQISKFLRNGELIIRKGEKEYTLQGQEIK